MWKKSIIGIVISTIITQASSYDIILSVDSNKELLMNDMKRAKIFINLQKMNKININIKKSGEEYVLIAGPIEGDTQLAATLFRFKKLFPSAFSVTIPSQNKPKEKDTIKKDIKSNNIEQTTQTPINLSKVASQSIWSQNSGWFWWLVGLGILIIIVFLIDLYISSIKVSKITEKYEEMRKRQKDLEQRQSTLFSNLGESVYNISQDVYQCTQNMISEVDNEGVSKKLQHMIRKESRLLNATEKLLRFLKLKAHKVEIKEKIFNINSLLDDIVGPLVNRYSGDSVELIFDLDKNLPKYLTGDLTQMGEICTNILEHMIEYVEDGEVIMYMSSYNTYDGKLDLNIKIVQNGFLIKEEISIEDYFVPYFDEISGEYRRLGLFVANSLIQLMNGQISLENISEESRQISISIPLKEAQGKERYRKYPLPERSMIEKDVYIVNKHFNASKALKNMFSYFRHNVTIDTEENFKERMPDLEHYDIILIEESLLYEDFVRYLRILKQKKDIKVVGLSNIFKEEEKHSWDDIFDKRVKKPLNQERTYLLIIDLYTKTPASEKDDKAIALKDDRIHKGERKHQFIRNVATTPDIRVEDFSDFRGARILIVEDNEINLKMILKVLERSGIELETAENGKEAIDAILKNGPSYYNLVLMDINMPVMDGYRATQEIYQIPEAEKLPIVALTALSTESEIERMRKSGLRAYLPKPLHLGKLYTVFSIYLKKKPHQEKIKSNIQKPLELEGIDIKMGLKHVDNNIIFYKEILEEFLRIYGDSGERAMKYLAEYRLEELRQLNLDVMGLAGTIGAKDVYHSAAMIHRVFGYNKIPLLQHYVKEYADNVEKVTKSIRTYLNSLDEDFV